MGNEMGVSLNQFKTFVSQRGEVGHDQVHVDSRGTLVSCANTKGSKIQRFFKQISQAGAAQASANQQVREAFLGAVRNEFNGKLPASVKALLEKSGVDTSLTGMGQHSTKSLSTRAIRVILSKVDEERGKLDAEKVSQLASGSVKGEISKASAKEIVAPMLATLKEPQREKVSQTLDRLFDAGVDPKKIVRVAYALTEGISKMAKSAGDDVANDLIKRLPKPSEDYKIGPGFEKPEEPSKTQGLFFKTEKPKEKYEAEMAQYRKDMAAFRQKCKTDYNSQYEECKEVGLKYETEMARDMFSCLDNLDSLPPDKMADAIIVKLHDTSEKISPGLWARTGSAGLDSFDALIQSRAISEGTQVVKDLGFEILEKPKSMSTQSACTIQLDVKSLVQKLESPIKLALKELADIESISIESGKDGRTLKLKLENFYMHKSKALYDMLGKAGYWGVQGQWKDLSLPLSFDLAPEGGKLTLSIGKLESKGNGGMAITANGLFPMMIANKITSVLAEKLGSMAYVAERNKAQPNQDGLLSSKDIAPVAIKEVKANDPTTLYKFEIDPGKLAPLKAMGFDLDTKFTGVNVENGAITLQAGGIEDETRVAQTVPNSTVSATANFGGVADRVKHLMEANGIPSENLTITGDPNTGKITVDVDKLDLSQKAKSAKFPVSTAMKLMSKGSYQLAFTPSINAATGDITLKIDNIKSKGHAAGIQNTATKLGKWGAKKFVRTIEATLREALAPAIGGDKKHPVVSVQKDSDGGVLKLTVKTSSILKLPQGASDLTGGDLSVKPSGIRVDENGLSIGFNLA